MGRKLINHEKHRSKGFYNCGAGNGTVAGGPALLVARKYGDSDGLWEVPSAPVAVGLINL